MASRVLLLLCAGLWAGLVVIPCSVSAAANVEGSCKNMTPGNFQEMFISNCRNLVESEEMCNTSYDLFLGGFSNRNASVVQRENYNPYFNQLPIAAMVNQSLFWSKTFDLIKLLSMMSMMGINIVTSENTVSGRILNDFMDPDLCWCSAAGNPGLVLDRICPRAATSRFWEQFSVRFAQAASGTVFYLADGNKRPAYNISAFFGCVELVNLNTTVVNRLVALNVHTEQGEACGTETFNVLQQNVTNLNMKYSCYDVIGNASNTSQHGDIAGCLKEIIGNVQEGTESGEYKVNCTEVKEIKKNSVKLVEVSFFLVIISLVLSLL